MKLKQLTFGLLLVYFTLHTDTDTCMHICILTADYTVNPVFRGHSKKKTNFRLMQVKSIGEHSAILSTSIKIPFVVKIIVLSFFGVAASDRLYFVDNLHMLSVLLRS